MKVLQI